MEETGENVVCPLQQKLAKGANTDYNFKREIVWFNVFGFTVLHIAWIYGFGLVYSAHPFTILWAAFLGFLSGWGVAVGAHRYYAHRTFKAKWIAKVIFIVLHTLAGQNCLYVWVRDHRLHHKFSDTDADPHNANRGFFFSHIGWLMSRKHPEVKIKGRTIDMSDLEADPLVMKSKKYYTPLYLLIAVIIPIIIPMRLWNESLINAFFIAYIGRFMHVLHVTWLINSAAHMFGTRPIDKTLKPVQNKIVAFLTVGEGWHNYHHAFPWDYRSAELGSRFNLSTYFIDFLAALGWVYDLKTASHSMIDKRALRTGDGTHIFGKRSLVGLDWRNNGNRLRI